MNRNRKRKKVAVSIAAGMSAVMCVMPVNAAAESEISKDETVYVNADASGKQTKVTVSDWLKGIENSGSLSDVSSLDEVKNVKGEETFTKNGSEIVWNAEGEDIYYQGTAKQDLPVSVELTYYLDGKEMKPEELKGKNGHLEIRIDYRNYEKRKVSVNGKEEEVYSPFVMMTGLVLPNETFSNVVIDNGKVINDGNRNIVIGFAMPGLKESLDLEMKEAEDLALTIPETLNISADVEDFSMSPAFTIGLTDLLEDIHTEDITDFDSLQASIDELENAALELTDGSRQLSAGADTLGSSYEEFDEGIQALKSGIEILDEGAGALALGVDQYTEGVDVLNGSIQKYLGVNGELSGTVTEYVNGVNTIALGAREYTEGADALAEGVTAYIKGEQQLSERAENLSKLGDGLEQVKTAAAQLAASVDGEGSSGEDILAASEELAKETGRLREVLSEDAVNNLLIQVDHMIKVSRELANASEGLETELQEEMIYPAENIAAALEDISGQLETMDSQLSCLEADCIDQVRQINNTVALNNEKIASAKNAAEQSVSSIETTIGKLEQEANCLEQEGQDRTAEEVRQVITDLDHAKNAAENLSGMENLNTVQEPDFSQIDISGISKTIDSIESDLNTFETAAGKLPGEMEDLKGGLDEISSVKEQLPEEDLKDLGSRVETLEEGMRGLNGAVESLSGGMEQLKDSSEELGEASQGIDSLLDGFDKLNGFNDSLRNGADQIKNSSPSIAAGIETMSGGTNRLAAGLDTLGTQMAQGSAGLSGRSGSLRNGAFSLASGTKELTKGGSSLQLGSAQVKGGISRLQSGAGALSAGMAQLEEEGTSRIQKAVKEELQGVLDRLEALSSETCRYDTFSGKDSSMDGTVKFVIETEGIE